MILGNTCYKRDITQQALNYAFIHPGSLHNNTKQEGPRALDRSPESCHIRIVSVAKEITIIIFSSDDLAENSDQIWWYMVL